MGSTAHSCVVCGAEAITLRPVYNDMLRVTSDSRIWKTGGEMGRCNACGMVQKPVTEAFQADASKIYATYEMYHQAGGHEQKIFTANGARSRSDVLLDSLTSLHNFPENCRVLDVGCGAGTLLRAAGKRMQGWQLYGNDISNHEKEKILGLDGVKGFFAGEVSTITETFDVICMSHVLEHIYEPNQFLQQLSKLLNPGGVLVILVPHWLDNYFDLLVADHCSHFTVPHMTQLLARAKYNVLQQSTTLLPKELFVLAQPNAAGDAATTPAQKTDTEAALDKALSWLATTCAWAVKEQQQGGSYAVLGTSLAATWLTHAAELTPACFVDEDTDRQGLTYLGKPVRAPGDVEDDTRVMIPLPPQIADKLAARLNAQRTSPLFMAPPVTE